jgi:hypothetical protein
MLGRSRSFQRKTDRAGLFKIELTVRVVTRWGLEIGSDLNIKYVFEIFHWVIL